MALFGPSVAKLKNKGRTQDLAALLEHDDERVRGEAKAALIELGEPSVAPLMGLLASDSDASALAFNALINIGPAARQPLMDLLGSPAASARARADAASALGYVGDASVIEPLIAALGEDQLARDAAEALGRLKDERAREPLADALAGSGPRTRLEVAVALAALNDARAVDPLLEFMKDADRAVRERARAGLLPMDDPRAVATLAEADAHRWDLIAAGFTGTATRWERSRATYEQHIQDGLYSTFDHLKSHHVFRLRELAHKMHELLMEYPTQAHVLGAGAAAGGQMLQIIAENSEEAADALEKGCDRLGHPIDRRQVAAGLRALASDMRGQIGLAATALNPDGVRLLQIVLDDIEAVADHLDP